MEEEADVVLGHGEDKMIPPPAQRFMSERANATVVKSPGSHATYASQPEVVTSTIKKAAQAQLTLRLRSATATTMRTVQAPFL